MKSASAKSASDDFIAPAKRAFLSVARQLRAENAAIPPVQNGKLSRIRKTSGKLTRASAR
jgi:hypothetical protein